MSVDSVVLVTGAANGIGAALSAELAGRGHRLVLVDRDAAGLAEVAERIGDRAVAATADVTDLAAVERAVEQGVAAFGGIDAVVTGAGIASYGSMGAVDPETFRRVLDVNVLGTFHTLRAALPHLLERRGYALLVSSLAAFAVIPGMAAYNASKAAVEHLATSLRVEVAHRGVAVGSAHMAWVDTPLVRDARSDLTAFDDMVAGLPAPLNRVMPVERCAVVLADGVEHRRRLVLAPRWVGAMRWARQVLASPAGDGLMRAQAERLLGRMDDEVRRLGRFTSARNV